MSKVALITGASAGIGWATSVALTEAGWSVVGASRRATAGEGWDAIEMDVDDDSSVAKGVKTVVERFGRLDALVTCAGWGVAGAMEQTQLQDARSQLETNFWGTVRAVQSVLPVMREQGSGRLVLLSSIGGVLGLPFASFYSASKFALEGLAEALAYEVDPFGVKVTILEPGNIRTEFTDKRRVSLVNDVQVSSCGMREETAAKEGQTADPYAHACMKAVNLMERTEQDGVSPDKVAAVILKVLESSRPPRRVSVGKASERIGLLAKRLLPFRLYEMAARGSLGV